MMERYRLLETIMRFIPKKQMKKLGEWLMWRYYDDSIGKYDISVFEDHCMRAARNVLVKRNLY